MRKLILSCVMSILLCASQIFSQDYTKIKSIIGNASIDTLIENLNLLTGEKPVTLDGNSVTISTRFRGTTGDSSAALFLKNKLNSYGGLKVSEQPLPDSGKNIIAVQTGTENPKRQIIVCAHYDCMPPGPISHGADDDGSGTAAVLEAARILSKYSSSNTIVYAFFDYEEDDLNGSEYYASHASQNGDTIGAVINLDMIGWDKNNQNDVEIDSKPSISLSDQLAKDVKDLNDKCNIGLYITIVNPGKSNADNDSFWKYNFPAILIIELYGYQNPYMHTVNDRVENINKPFYERCTKLGIASIARYTDLNVNDGTTSVKEMPTSYYSLEQNYPNPFNPTTTITYQLPKSENIKLKIYNLLGEEVKTLVEDNEVAGIYHVKFDGSNFASGVYFYRLRAGNFVDTKKLILMK